MRMVAGPKPSAPRQQGWAKWARATRPGGWPVTGDANTSLTDAMPPHREEAYLFGRFRLVPSSRQLFDGTNPVAVGSRALDLLTVLVRASGSVVKKANLLAQVWPDATVDEGSLRVQIASLHKILGEDDAGRRWILNVPGQGYSFAAPVTMQYAARHPSAGRVTGERDNLPTNLSKVIGRQASIDFLVTELPQRRFITLVGPGGIGKTTVALFAASAVRSNYADGTWFVDLAPVADPALVPSVIASALGLPVKSRDLIPDLIAFCHERQLLLLLDNCEHVIDVAATVAEAILVRAPGVHILATSRERLRAQGEHIIHLGPLDVPPDHLELSADTAMAFSAVQLFVERARASAEGFDFTDALVPSVREICRRLDGMALAIELASGRVDTLGVQGVAAQLDNRFDLLSRGLRSAPPRHRTLNAVFDWSHELLPPAAQRVFMRLSVFNGPFHLDAAQHIASDHPGVAAEVTENLALLVSASLLSADISRDPPAYRLLDSARAYARDRLQDAGETERIARRHAEYFLGLFERAIASSSGWSSARWVESYKPQLDNLRAALDWASASADYRLRDALTIAAVPLLTHMSLDEECRARVQAALTDRPNADPLDRRCEMYLLAALGMALLYTRGGGSEASAAWRDCLAVAEELDDKDYQLRAIRGLWTGSVNGSDLATARDLSQYFAKIAGARPSLEDALVRDRMRGMEHFYGGELREAQGFLQRVFDGYADDIRGSDILRFQFDQTVLACVNLAKIFWLRGFPDRSMGFARQSLAVARQVDHELSVTYALAYAACRIAIVTGEHEEAELYLQQLFERASVDRSGPWKLFAQCWKGTLLSRQGAASEGAEILADALRHIPEGSIGAHHTRFLGELAYAQARSGEVDLGAANVRRAIRISEDQNELWYLPELLRLEGEIQLLRGGAGDHVGARLAFEKALNLAHHQGALSFELRSAASLARLDALDGSDRGAKLLKIVFAGFEEGFETTDLIDAATLLRDLKRAKIA